MILVYRDYLRNTIGSAGAGENKILNTVVAGGFQQSQSAGHVIAIIFTWILYRFSDISISGKVHYGFGLIFSDDLI